MRGLIAALLLWAVRGVRLPYIGWYAAGFAAAAAGLAVEVAADRGWLAGWRWDGQAALAGAGLEIVILTYALNFSARDMLGEPASRREGARLDRWTGLLHGGEGREVDALDRQQRAVQAAQPGRDALVEVLIVKGG